MSPKPHSSPAALILAGLALFVAVGGSAYAAGTINGSSIVNHSIAGIKMKANTLTGAHVNESLLGTVPRASTAANVNGIVFRKILYKPATASPTSVTILSLGGLTLQASCNGGVAAIIATTSVNHSHLSSMMFNSGNGGQADGLHRTDFNTNSLDDLTDQNSWGETTFTYTTPAGVVVSGELSFDSSSVIGGNIFNHQAACLVSGFAQRK
jgi:hypothetical protein